MTTQARAMPGPHLSICDTGSYAPNEAFSAFREAIASAFMPWSLERRPEKNFSAIITNFTTRSVSFGRSRMTPIRGIRAKSEISKSPDLCLYANYVISGELVIEQGGRMTSAKGGDLIIYDSTRPVNHIKVGDCPFEDISFSIPKDRISCEGRTFENLAIPGPKIIAPLAASLKFLSQNMLSSSSDELEALGRVCATLLSIASSDYGDYRRLESIDLMSSRRAREMMRYIEANLDNSDLSPSTVAAHLGISVRYVHKQFAVFGMTFSDYVRSKRLEHISADLQSDVGRGQQISSLAYRWGFNDLSTFNRSFKKKFGCLPREFRSKFG